jgi:hypothetical protein
MTLHRSGVSTAARQEHRHVALTWAPLLRLNIALRNVGALQRDGRRAPLARVLVSRSAIAAMRAAVRGWTSARSTGAIAGAAPRGGRRLRNTAAALPLARVFARAAGRTIDDGGAVVREADAGLDALVKRRARVESRTTVVGRVLNRARHEPAEATPATADPRSIVAQLGTPARLQLEAAAMTESGVNLLTERVIRQIDRRLVAYRERLGRIG